MQCIRPRINHKCRVRVTSTGEVWYCNLEPAIFAVYKKDTPVELLRHAILKINGVDEVVIETRKYMRWALEMVETTDKK